MLLGSDEAGSAVAREKVLEWVKGDSHHGATWPVNLLTSDDQPPESLICGDLDEADQFRNLGRDERGFELQSETLCSPRRHLRASSGRYV